MILVPSGAVGRILAALWLSLCLAVLVFGFVQRDVHDMPVAFVWFLILLSFPCGAAGVIVVGAAFGTGGPAVGIHYLPFWSELPYWVVAVALGYLQWFVLVPTVFRFVLALRTGDA